MTLVFSETNAIIPLYISLTGPTATASSGKCNVGTVISVFTAKPLLMYVAILFVLNYRFGRGNVKGFGQT